MATYSSFNPKCSTKGIEASHTKLLHLASDSIQGGAESVFRNTILQTLQLKDYHIFVASCDNQNNISKEVKAFVKLDDWGDYPKWRGAYKYIFNFKNYRLLKHFLFTQQPDIIHTQNYLSRLSPSVLFALKTYKNTFHILSLSIPNTALEFVRMEDSTTILKSAFARNV
ncbi:hypothetical protein [Helicobacter typhlonius]|uniref:hypothetical protein n=1 Tax=Helicobacter typhlonius TaxID=76936 RepID=UPI002FE30304